jgi:DNA-binding MarR family transcriptional regulator
MIAFQTKLLNTTVCLHALFCTKKGIYLIGGNTLANKTKLDMDIFDVFFRKKPAMILVALRKGNRNRYGSVLAKEVDCTYSHAVKILQEMEKAKLVTFERTGRIKTISLTDSGNKIAEHIERIQDLL